ncbi:MAG: bifunctional nuclease family protein [Prevotella sp.]|nr:bifunctional nuclease family protein [Prevotella sp.]MBR6715716.1 bifunctional nuclease family protein [Prevotella sp.]
MTKIPLKFRSVSQIVGSEKLGLLVLVDEQEQSQLAIPCDPAMLQQFELRMMNVPIKHLLLPEVLWQVISSQTDMQFEILITDIIEEQYRAILYNTETLEPVAIRASDAVLLSFIGNVPLYIEEKLMKRQSVPYRRSSMGVAMPLNAISSKMLEEALDKAVKDENYELASHLRDEMRRRKLL